jgi:hypothetical protein
MVPRCKVAAPGLVAVAVQRRPEWVAQAVITGLVVAGAERRRPKALGLAVRVGPVSFA